MKKILILHGPNLNLTGEREIGVYGREDLEKINSRISEEAGKLGLDCEIVQSNHEGVLIDLLQQARLEKDGVILNAGAYSHYSYAIRDAIAAIRIPCVEVHLSNIYAREEFRHHSVLSEVCAGVIAGFGAESYLLALRAMKELL